MVYFVDTSVPRAVGMWIHWEVQLFSRYTTTKRVQWTTTYTLILRMLEQTWKISGKISLETSTILEIRFWKNNGKLFGGFMDSGLQYRSGWHFCNVHMDSMWPTYMAERCNELGDSTSERTEPLLGETLSSICIALVHGCNVSEFFDDDDNHFLLILKS